MNLPILMYHGVGHTKVDALKRFFVSPDLFSEHLDALEVAGYHPLALRDLPQLRRNPPKTPSAERHVIVTFDDAFSHLLRDAVPTLERHRFTATIFAPTAHIGQTAGWLPGDAATLPILGAEELRDLHRRGFEIAAHSRTHPHLDELPRKAARGEIEGAKGELEELLGAPVETFAYPFGHLSPETQRLVRAAGYRAACAVKRRLATTRDDLYALPRLEVTPWTTPDALLAALTRPQSNVVKRLTQGRDEVFGLARRSLQAVGLR